MTLKPYDKEIDVYSFFCFYTLYNKLTKPLSLNAVQNPNLLSLKNLREKPPFNSQQEGLAEEKSPLFVTWLKQINIARDEEIKDLTDISSTDEDQANDEANYDLRGCIGTFSKVDLGEGLKDYALISALQDTRFPPIKHNELKFLKCNVSILNSFKIIYHKSATDIGMHHYDSEKDNKRFWSHISKNFHILPDDLQNTNGIEIKFTYQNSKFSSTFLPEVMVENSFDVEETFEHLVMKALSRDHSSPEVLGLITKVIMRDPKKYMDKVETYKSSKSSITFNKFKQVISSWKH